MAFLAKSCIWTLSTVTEECLRLLQILGSFQRYSIHFCLFQGYYFHTFLACSRLSCPFNDCGKLGKLRTHRPICTQAYLSARPLDCSPYRRPGNLRGALKL